MTTMPQTDAVDRIRAHLDQAQRDGRRPPGKPALVEATGLSEHVVRTALDKIKEGGDARRAPTTTRHHQRAGERQPTTRTESASPAKAPSPADSRTDLAPSQPPGGISGDHPTTTSAKSPVGGTPSSGGTAVGWLGFAFGSVTSIAANVLHTWLPASTQPPGWTPGLGPQLGAGVWPIALIVTVEVLTRVNWLQTWFWNAVRYGIGTIGRRRGRARSSSAW
ncbi:hypothetical protein ACFVYA_21685 [Amycolatopsis sp. NPDC058278]|uniref:hypothetical protein n=1 Tax=Amycolatopsis sp. NPDC058278 TaxID=3346417 RepID=UPI0036DCD63E